ncbi:phosphoglycerate mutase [Paenibacillus baekrokdamisoli]|uniref:Phosphoglycerate mutase n=1 Tax=Paenibacillus baekrokdamisoli TaxID=1712516 RepID=A0A3G9JCL7_9BACL|nr:histidine phosphatase family protein [Paenibacillus baekrokdamisoli]MBB3069672.1 putative phosphoglycerate mutase [Paenibacillus baekrokdamisoli]BBH20974.1 phosphoglycerate mutase [Paenibacillus baekrokdamisoli]
MRLGLIRHGKTDWNALGKIQGQTDTPLNDEGIRQAHALADRLSHDTMQWDAIISSDLSRAYDTARIIAAKLNIPLLPSEVRLRERFFGEIEGTTEEERLRRWGVNWRKSESGQESDETVRGRALSFVDEAAVKEPTRNLLVVSHGSLLAQLLKGMCAELEDKPIGNLSFSIMQNDNNKWSALLHNCTRHLEQLQK